VYHGWGGVAVPYGFSYWHVAPYHWLWWMGWPNPYPAYHAPSHAGFFTSFLMTIVFLIVTAIIVAIVVSLIRRASTSRSKREWPPRGWEQ
jgi:hypothetical protein